MKKTLLIANVLFAAFLFFSCKQQETSKRECPTGCKDYTDVKMKGIIDAGVAYDIANAYKGDKGKSTIDGSGEEDATSIWFDLETLKQYIWKMETELAKRKISADSLGLGIRIYYAKYPDVETMKKLGFRPEYALHHTAFLVATYKGKKNNVDFDPWNIGNNNRPTPLKELLQRRGNIGRAAAAGAGGGGQEDGIGVLNQGDLKPPPSGNGVDFPEDDN